MALARQSGGANTQNRGRFCTNGKSKLCAESKGFPDIPSCWTTPFWVFFWFFKDIGDGPLYFSCILQAQGYGVHPCSETAPSVIARSKATKQSRIHAPASRLFL